MKKHLEISGTTSMNYLENLYLTNKFVPLFFCIPRIIRNNYFFCFFWFLSELVMKPSVFPDWWFHDKLEKKSTWKCNHLLVITFSTSKLSSWAIFCEKVSILSKIRADGRCDTNDFTVETKIFAIPSADFPEKKKEIKIESLQYSSKFQKKK